MRSAGPSTLHAEMPIVRTIIAGAALAAAALTASGEAHAQRPVGPFRVEARTGLALPSDAFGDDALADGGWATEVSLGFQPLPLVGVYAAYSWAEFQGEGDADRVTDRGASAGVRVDLPTPLIPIDPWIRVGVVAHTLEAEALQGDETASGTGWQAGAGLNFRLTRRISLTPGLVWTEYTAEGVDGDVRVESLRASIGARLRI